MGLQARSTPLKRSADVVEAPPAVMSHLGRRGPRAHELAGRFGEVQAPAEPAREKLRLVVSALAQSSGVKRHGDHPSCRQALHDQAFHHDLRDLLPYPPPPPALDSPQA